jgi:hypothetical protein
VGFFFFFFFLTIQKGNILARHVFHVDKPCQKK